MNDPFDRAIAVIGLSIRCPGANDAAAFWANLRDGVESIRHFSREELVTAGVAPEVVDQPGYVRARGMVDHVECFDAGFFGITPREAELIDPQHRLFLECAWEALERAGYAGDAGHASVGVFAAAGINLYLRHVLAREEGLGGPGALQVQICNDKDHLATRVSYKLDLRGPSMAIQTACSSSLTAVVTACQQLLAGSCEMALAGGSSIRLPQQSGYLYHPGSISSPDGHCRVFDARAEGTVGGSGCGVVLLKRYHDAIRDGDHVHAVIRGWGINNDGALKAGYTAPAVQGQAAAVRGALSAAGVDAQEISYVEAHGTGTLLGDPIEIAALTQAFGGPRSGARCAIGSVKSNVGHLDTAAGVVGLIKTALMLEHRELVPSLHFETPNPHIGFEKTPFEINVERRPWSAGPGRRRAGVSSFGLGGTNVHVILEEPPARAASADGDGDSDDDRESDVDPQLLVLSARSDASLAAMGRRLADHLEQQPHVPLRHVARMLQSGRKAFDRRRAIAVENRAAAIATLHAGLATPSVSASTPASAVFLFPGQGAQFAGMGRDIYERHRVFRDRIDECAELFRVELGRDIRTLIFPGLAERDTADERLRRTLYAQPALFAIEYALAHFWMALGVRPEALAGHSLGEYVAACVADVFSLPDAVRIVAARARLMDSLPPGSMMTVAASAARVRPLLGLDVSVAAINTRETCVISGPSTSIDAVRARLAADGIDTRLLRTSHAFHSGMMDRVLEPFAAEVAKATPGVCRIPFVSNVTGTWIEERDYRDPMYWARHLRETVRFADALATLTQDAERLLLELGPGRALSACAVEDGWSAESLAASIGPARGGAPRTLLEAIGRAWTRGADIRWDTLHDGEPLQRIPLPTYAFDRQRYWLDAPSGQSGQSAQARDERRRKKSPQVTDWMYVPSWKRTAPLHERAWTTKPRTWLVFATGTPLEQQVRALLEARGHRWIEVRPGATFTADADGYTIDPSRADDYHALMQSLHANGARPAAIAHFWLTSSADHTGAEDTAAEETIDGSRTWMTRGLHSLLFLLQAVERARAELPRRIALIGTSLFDVSGAERIASGKAPVVAALRVISQEYDGLESQVLDLDPVWLAEPTHDRATRVVAELLANRSETGVALRGAGRWRACLEPLRRPAAEWQPRVKTHGVYLITGGLGRIGLTLARWLAERYQARLILTHRPSSAAASHEDDRRARAIELEKAGAEVTIASVDVADAAQMKALVDSVRQRHGRLDGVIHAAGITGHAAIRPVLETTTELCETLWRGKAEGADALVEALDGLDGHAPDFVLLCSSLSTVMGGLGLCAYAAANHYMDAIAHRQHARGQQAWMAVGLDGWRFTAEADREQPGILPDEGTRLIELLTGAGDLPYVAISVSEPDTRVATAPAAASREAPSSASAGAAPARHARPELDTAYVAAASDSERVICGVFEELLGISPIGVDDDVFALGADSLIVTQAASRLRIRLSCVVPLRDLFECSNARALAERLVKASASETDASTVALTRRRHDGPSLLSFAQQRLWFLEGMSPGTARYHIRANVRMHGQLRVGALAAGLDTVLERHDVLRASFDLVDDEPKQSRNEIGAWPLRVVDLGGLDPDDRQREGARLASAVAQAPFDLRQAPLVRASLFRYRATEHVLALVIHHIVFDNWSMSILVRELAEQYGARLEGRAPEVAPLPVTYADFAAWQRARLSAPLQEQQLAYWQEQLAGAPPALDLPMARTRPPLITYHGARCTRIVPQELSRRFIQTCRAEGVTLFGGLLTTWQTLLLRYTGATDIVVGSPSAGRNRLELEPLIGFFVNTLVMRTRLDPGMPFREALQRTRETMLGAYANEDIPFERLVEHLDVPRDRSRTPIFQVVFSPQNLPDVDLPGLTFELEEPEVDSAPFDLVLYAADTRRGVALTLRYNTDLFERADAERMLSHVQSLLEEGASRPDRLLRDMPLGDDRRPESFPFTAADAIDEPEAADDICVDALFFERAREHPDAIALVSGERQISYGLFAERAETWAARLQALGVGGEHRVVICLDRSIELMVALVAVCRAGAAYVPLDPHMPFERLTWLIDDVRPTVVIVAEGAGDRLARPGLAVVELTDARIEPETAAPVARGADHLAYVMYTSGSTGTPKGVSVTHRGILRLADDRVARLDARTVMLQMAPAGFDASTFEIWGGLLTGARLVLAPPGPVSIEDLGSVLARHEVNTLWLTAAMFHLVVSEDADVLRPLTQLLAGGDALSRPHIDRVRRALPHVTLINGYGPTECTTFACCHRFADDDGGSAVPIGTPIARTTAWILDESGAPVPSGLIGELYLGGAGLARGYHERAGLTAERFLPAPGGRPGTRMYRTGDLARYDERGAIVFCGRRDGQVKIRGYRIEPAEIEQTLCAHPAVGQAAVLCRQGDNEDKYLAAYVVPAALGADGGAARGADAAALTSELKEYLKRALPEYMIPTVIVALDRLPMTANGKLDRAALPDASGAMPATPEASGAAPRTPVEDVIATIWSQSLGVDTIRTDDNFFELGGHSLLVTQVVSRMRKALGVELSLPQMFEFPTVRELAACVEASLREGQPRDEGIRPVAREGEPLPLSWAQQRLWFVEQLNAGSGLYNIPVALRLIGPLSVDALAWSFDQAVVRHHALRTRFVRGDSGPVQIVEPPYRVPMPIVDLRGLGEADRERQIRVIGERVSQRPFELTAPERLRVCLCRLGSDEHVLMLSLQHIAGDGWSMGVLAGEISAPYRRHCQGDRSVAAPLAVQYTDYAVWQRRWLEEGALERQLAYWTHQLASLPLLALPTDSPRPPRLTASGGSHALIIDADLTRAVKAFSRREGATLFMTLLAMWNVVLHRMSRQTDIVVGTDIANRGRVETEPLIGFFVNQLVLRTALDDDPSFRALVGRVRRVTLEAYANQDLPFDRLVEALQPVRDPSRMPLFQVKFVLQNAPAAQLALNGVRAERIGLTTELTKNDLLLTATETQRTISLVLGYNSELFRSTTTLRLLREMEWLMRAVVHDPDASLSTLVAGLDESAAEIRLQKSLAMRQAIRQKLQPAAAASSPS